MADIQPYKVSVSQDSLDLLQKKLSLVSLPDELEDAGWDYGAPLADIKRLVQYWKEKYDWRKHETQMNKLPQYMTSISVKGFGDLDIHFVHQTSSVPTAIPLLFVHGCTSFHILPWPSLLMNVRAW